MILDVLSWLMHNFPDKNPRFHKMIGVRSWRQQTASREDSFFAVFAPRSARSADLGIYRIYQLDYGSLMEHVLLVNSMVYHWFIIIMVNSGSQWFYMVNGFKTGFTTLLCNGNISRPKVKTSSEPTPSRERKGAGLQSVMTAFRETVNVLFCNLLIYLLCLTVVDWKNDASQKCWTWEGQPEVGLHVTIPGGPLALANGRRFIPWFVPVQKH